MKTINNNPELGFIWLGKLALTMESFDRDEPSLSIKELPTEKAKTLKE